MSHRAKLRYSPPLESRCKRVSHVVDALAPVVPRRQRRGRGFSEGRGAIGAEGALAQRHRVPRASAAGRRRACRAQGAPRTARPPGLSPTGGAGGGTTLWAPGVSGKRFKQTREWILLYWERKRVTLLKYNELTVFFNNCFILTLLHILTTG